MYRRRILSSLVTLRTPDYPGRSFLHARLEGLEQAILLAVLESAAPLLRYRRSPGDCRALVIDWGRMWLLVDDVQDESADAASDAELLAVLLGEGTLASPDPRVRELVRAARAVTDAMSRTPWWDDYRRETRRCLESQRVVTTVRTDRERVARTLEAAETKAGAFALGLVHLANPEALPAPIAEAIFWFGAWVQAVDDYADREKDARTGVFTVFSTAADPEATFDELAARYRERIAERTGRRDALIPLAEDLMWLARLSRLPVVKPIFARLNQ